MSFWVPPYLGHAIPLESKTKANACLGKETDCVGDLSNTTSFLLSQIAQQKADAPAKACLFSFSPNWFNQEPNIWHTFVVLLSWKPHYISPTKFLHNNIHKKDVVYSRLHGKNNIAYSHSSFFLPNCPLLGPPPFAYTT
jgi:hypothetical protein